MYQIVDILAYKGMSHA